MIAIGGRMKISEAVKVEIAKLELAPGDVLVVKMPGVDEYVGSSPDGPETLVAVEEAWSLRIGGNKVLIMDARADLTVIKAA